MIEKKTKTPKTVRLRIDDEAFDAVPLKDGAFRVAEVVLSHLCTHGDVVKADETGRVVAVVRNRFETRIAVCASEEEAARLGEEYALQRVPYRIEMGDVVLSAAPIEAPFDFGDYIDPFHEKEEYDYAWGCIKSEFGDFDCEHRGEVWQYMGSYGTHWFRHRHLPRSRGYTSREYPYSEGWKAKRPVPDGRMLRFECGSYEVGVWGEADYDEDGLKREFVSLDEHDSLRVRRHVVKTLGLGGLEDRSVFRGHPKRKDRRYWEWSKEVVEAMLSATLTEESCLDVEYMDRTEA